MVSLSNTIGTAIFALVALPFLIVAIVFVVIMIRSNRKARASQNWSTTSGRVLDSHVATHGSLESNGTHTTLYEPAIAYEYNVSGQRFQSTHVRFGMQLGTSWPQPAEQIIEQYPAGSAVQVFYNPTDPTEAVLEHSTGGSNRTLTCVVIFIIGVLLIAGASMFFMQGFVSQIMKLVPHF